MIKNFYSRIIGSILKFVTLVKGGLRLLLFLVLKLQISTFKISICYLQCTIIKKIYPENIRVVFSFFKQSLCLELVMIISLFVCVLNTLMLYGKFPPKIMPLVITECI